jgi:hypothetical protein
MEPRVRRLKRDPEETPLPRYVAMAANEEGKAARHSMRPADESRRLDVESQPGERWSFVVHPGLSAANSTCPPRAEWSTESRVSTDPRETSTTLGEMPDQSAVRGT